VPVLIAAWALWSWTARRDTVSVTAIDDGYEIRITSVGRSMLPIGPEGPFKKWSQETRFLAQGSGEQAEIDGLTCKKYTLGRDLETTWLSHMFSICTIYVSEDAKRLVVQGTLAADTKYLINLSGTYNGITIDHPEILPLPAHATIEDFDRRYVRVRGHVKDGFLKTGGNTVAVGHWNEGDYEVVGLVYKRRGDLPLLDACAYKRILEN
jgi:hypothetical protein